jgi:hypothetical protein
MDLTFVNLTEKPELTAAMWAVHSTWPEFMLHDPLADRCYPRLAATFPEHQILGMAADGKVVTRINSVPFKWTRSDEDLPDRGWDVKPSAQPRLVRTQHLPPHITPAQAVCARSSPLAAGAASRSGPALVRVQAVSCLARSEPCGRHGELCRLGHRVSEATVRRILRARRCRPAHRTWTPPGGRSCARRRAVC